jgi:hypothetical protein
MAVTLRQGYSVMAFASSTATSNGPRPFATRIMAGQFMLATLPLMGGWQSEAMTASYGSTTATSRWFFLLKGHRVVTAHEA